MDESLEVKDYLSFFKRYLHFTKKRVTFIIIFTVISMILSGVLTYFLISPVYKSSTTIITTKSNLEEGLTYDDFNLSENLTTTYKEIIKSRAVLEQVISDLKLNISYEELLQNVTLDSVSGTQVLKIEVKDSNPKIAMEIANKIPTIFEAEGKKIINLGKVTIVDKATQSKKPSSPNYKINVLAAAFIGIVASICIIFLPQYLYEKINDKELDE